MKRYTKMEVTEVLLLIASGAYDKDLQRIKDGAYNRQKLIRDSEGAERLATLEAGDVVQFVKDMRPNYLGGARAVVVGFEGETVILRMLETRTHGKRSYRLGGRVTAPATILKPTGEKNDSYELQYE